MRNIFILLFSLSIVFASCDDPYANEDFAAYTEQPMGIYLETKPAYASWVQLLKKADLYNALNVKSDFTCFVANNEAVKRYLQANNLTSIDALTEEKAKSIVSYHIVPDIILSQGALDGQLSDKTASDDYLSVKFPDKKNPDEKFLEGVKIINYDQDVVNGVVHEIEDVLSPPLYTVGELLAESGRYEIFNEAIKLCGIDVYLNLKEIDVDHVKVKDFKTILVVSDEVFKENGILTLADLIAAYPGNPKDYRSPFYMYVAYHIIPGSYDYRALKTREDLDAKGKNFQTYAKNQFISITDNKGLVFYINEHTEKVMFDSVYIDIKGNNGFIHEVDKLMTVSLPLGFPFYHEFTFGKEFEALDFYRANNTKKEQKFTENLEFIKWTTIPSKVGVIKYVNSVIQNMPMSNDDWLMVDFMSQIGSIDFSIPTIVPGKYKVTLFKWAYSYGVNNSTSGKRAGSCQTYFDGEQLGAEMNHGDHGGFRTLVGEVTIREAKEHVMTFQLMREGPLGFDRVIFEPIQ